MTIASISSAVLASWKSGGRSFELKIVLLSLVATFGALALSLSFSVWQNWEAEEADLVFDQTAIGEHMAREMRDPADANGASRARAIFMADEHLQSFAYFPAAGPKVEFHHSDEAAIALRPSGAARRTVTRQDGDFIIHLPQVTGGRRIGELVLQVHNEEESGALQHNILQAILVGSVAALLAGGLAKVLAQRALRPLHVLRGAIGEVRRSKDFSHPVTSASTDEFGHLAGDFNDLLAELDRYSHNLHEALADVTAGRDAAQDANRMKSQFLANMSHEIRTPLNGVMGMAQAMETEDLSDAQRMRLEVIRKSGSTLLTVLNDVLDISKIEAGRLEIEAAPFDLAEVAESACAMFEAVALDKGLGFHLDIAHTAQGNWMGDAMRVRQMIHHLLSNAIKFTERGEVRVGLDRTGSAGHEVLAIRVCDTGVGVAEESVPRLFEKFTQADNSVTRRFGGTGVGLTICRHIVELMGGVIEMRSELGRGSVFEIALPLPWLGAPTADAEAPESGEGDDTIDISRLRVLAAEDNETNQLVIRTLLGAYGVDAVIVGDGRQAVEAWKTGDFDLVLMDIQMPVLDGMAATREIRALETARDLPRTRIVAVSANAMSHQVAEHLAAGIDSQIAKPISMAHLQNVLIDAAMGATPEAGERAA